MEKGNTDNREKALRLSDSGIIELKGMMFKAFHGCLEKERTDGNTFTVDLRFHCDISKAAVTDKLEDTVDYAAVYEVVKKEMEKPSCLLENVCARIFNSLSCAFPLISGLEVKVSKKNPPVSGSADWSSVTCKSEE